MKMHNTIKTLLLPCSEDRRQETEDRKMRCVATQSSALKLPVISLLTENEG